MAIEIVGFPINSMVIFHGKLLVHQAGYGKIWVSHVATPFWPRGHGVQPDVSPWCGSHRLLTNVCCFLLCCLRSDPYFAWVAVLELSQVSITYIYIHIYICVCIIYNHTFEYMAIQIISPFPRFTSYFSMSFFGRKKKNLWSPRGHLIGVVLVGKHLLSDATGYTDISQKDTRWANMMQTKKNVRGCAGIHKDFWTFRMFFYVFLVKMEHWTPENCQTLIRKNGCKAVHRFLIILTHWKILKSRI